MINLRKKADSSSVIEKPHIGQNSASNNWIFFRKDAIFRTPFILRKFSFVFYLSIISLGIARSGFSIFGQKIRDFNKYRDSSLALGFDRHFVLNFSNWLGTKFGGSAYLIFISLLLIIFFALLYFEIRHLSSCFKKRFFFLLSISPVFTLIFQRFGNVDTFALLAGVLGALSKSRSRIVFYSLIFAGTHSEAAIISGIVLLIYHLGLKANFRVASQFFSFLLIFFGGIIFLIGINDPDSRTQTFQDFIKYGIAQDLASGTLIFYSWFGALWLIVIAEFYQADKLSKLSLVLATTFGGLFMLIAADGTRVSCLIFTPLLTALISNNLNFRKVETLDSKWFLIFYLMPTINISNLNIFLPFHQVLYLFGVAQPVFLTLFK